MVRIIISGDGTYARLDKEEQTEIARLICSKRPEFLQHVEIFYKDESDALITHERTLDYVYRRDGGDK